MSCTFATLALCFSLDGFYIHSDIGVQNYGEGRVQERTVDLSGYSQRFRGLPVPYQYEVTELYMEDSPQSPYVTVSFGYDIKPTEWLRVMLEIRHVSSIKTGRDHGFDGAYFGFNVRPAALFR